MLQDVRDESKLRLFCRSECVHQAALCRSCARSPAFYVRQRGEGQQLRNCHRPADERHLRRVPSSRCRWMDQNALLECAGTAHDPEACKFVMRAGHVQTDVK